MRYEAEVVALSWIPSEAVEGTMKLPFDVGVAHYDEPPPDQLGDLEELREADRFRFANRLRAWIEVDDAGAIVAQGYSGGVLLGSTTLFKGTRMNLEFAAYPMPLIQREAIVDDGWARFVQTGGGRTALPAPRRVRRKPFVQWRAPLAWSTLELTIHNDGRAVWDVKGASPFPRHWIYGPDGDLAGKTGMIDFDEWYREAFGKHSPWGDEDSPALVTAAESALERLLSRELMKGGNPEIREVERGTVVVTEGEPGNELLLLLDGVLRVEKGGERLAELGPGAILGERAILEGGARTATLVAVTPCRLAVAAADSLDREALAEVSRGHRREEQ